MITPSHNGTEQSLGRTEITGLNNKRVLHTPSLRKHIPINTESATYQPT